MYIKGLPEDISHDELKDFFIRAGILKIDSDSNQEKIKIYMDDQEKCKVFLSIFLSIFLLII